jgi:inorganic pyrophosphatase
VYNIWRQMLDEHEKIAKARLAAVQVFHDEVGKDAKVVRQDKQAKTKTALERLAVVHKELQTTVTEVQSNEIEKTSLQALFANFL